MANYPAFNGNMPGSIPGQATLLIAKHFGDTMKTLPLQPGAVTDATPERLFQAGWRLERDRDPFAGWWQDPRTGEWYAISQAEAIRKDRATPRYRFK